MDRAESKHEESAGVVPVSGLPGLAPRHAAELNRLGQLRETYKPDTSSRLLWICFTVFFLLFGLLVAAIPFLPTPKGVAPAPLVVVLPIVLAIALIVAGCVWRLRRLTWERRARILVFADGLARFDGKSLLTCRWEEIESVQGLVYKAPQPFACHIIIAIRGGKPIRAQWAQKHLAEAQVLLQRVSEESCRHLLPRFLAAIEAGQTLTFEPHVWGVSALGISKSGLHWGRHDVAWDDTENIDFNDGLRVRNPKALFGQPWTRLEDIPIPNYLVFLRLAEHFMRKNGRVIVSPGQDS